MDSGSSGPDGHRWVGGWHPHRQNMRSCQHQDKEKKTEITPLPASPAILHFHYNKCSGSAHYSCVCGLKRACCHFYECMLLNVCTHMHQYVCMLQFWMSPRWNLCMRSHSSPTLKITNITRDSSLCVKLKLKYLFTLSALLHQFTSLLKKKERKADQNL